MYSYRKNVNKQDEVFHRAPKEYRERVMYLDLFRMMYEHLVAEGKDINDFVITFEEREDVLETAFGEESFTVYEIRAMTPEEARLNLTYGERYINPPE